MEEETLYDRIGEADLNPTYKDGQVYQHTDVNNMLSILKTAVNENYHDIQKLENGTKTVGNANKLSGATLSRYLDETLQADDNKIPSSQQAKAYVDDLFSSFSPPIRGVDYWTEEDQDYVINETADQVKIKMAETIKNMGEYDSQTNYEKLNVVTYQGSSYCALKDTTGNLPTNSEYWQLYAEKGNQGDKGEKGDKGDKGDTGETGARGLKGDKGEKGDKGDTGDTGPANTLSIGTVEKGQEASASITGTSPNQTLNLVLPKGDKGDTGPQGPKGNDGTGVTILGSYNTYNDLVAEHPSGNVGEAYLVGGYLYVWSATTNTWENVGNIQGPQGPQGLQGVQGPQGNQGEKGDKGDSGVWVGEDTPTGDYDVWVDPEGTTGTIPTKTSDLTNDSGYLTSETDPVFNASVAKNITSTDITNWNNKQAALVSGTNIKTINNTSILGNGNISLPQVTDSYSVSTTDSYSCNYVNGLNGKILYENPSGTSSSFSLSEDWKNFKEIEVYFLATDRFCNSSKMDCNSQASLVLATPYGDQSTSIDILSVIIQFYGTTVSFTKPRTMTFDPSYEAPTITESADIKVTKVIGYR